LIELGRIHVFAGAYGSGKSNLLEAVGVLGAVAW
jgi:AAA15 family ATPase/GTPase